MTTNSKETKELSIQRQRMGKEIRRLREEKGFGLNEFAVDVEINQGNMSRIERGLQGVAMDTLTRIAKRLGVPMYRLLAVAEGAILPIESDGSALLPVVRIGHIGALCDLMKKKGTTTMDVSEQLNVPVVSGSAAGLQGDFVLELRGAAARSMAPDYQAGDQAVISMSTDPEPGDHVIAKLKNQKEAIFRVYKPRSDGSIDLEPLNDDWPTVKIDTKNPGEIVGVMVERRHPRRRD